MCALENSPKLNLARQFFSIIALNHLIACWNSAFYNNLRFKLFSVFWHRVSCYLAHVVKYFDTVRIRVRESLLFNSIEFSSVRVLRMTLQKNTIPLSLNWNTFGIENNYIDKVGRSYTVKWKRSYVKLRVSYTFLF